MEFAERKGKCERKHGKKRENDGRNYKENREER